MRPISHDERLVLAAAYLCIPSGTLRLLASGDESVLRRWERDESPHRLKEARNFAGVTADRLERERAYVLTFGDPDYPSGLRDLSTAPPFLIVRGTLPFGGVAIIGSRTPPAEAAAFALVLARALREPTIAGLALGIDAQVHRGTMEAGAATVAYVGYGLGATYPAEHRKLEREIIKCGGAIATERLPGETAAPWALVKRDRLQAAHANAIVLVASEIDGGAMHTMHFATKLGRPRFVLDAKGGSGYEGNVQARQAGATPIPMDVEAAVERIRSALES
ncbi:MAG: DNA-processing protein DprA [Candidatus Eremiobacteraeota bacterium]|nr:DNA-processing protein DprA [Candidatus Eremiobacteraeota bacterium]